MNQARHSTQPDDWPTVYRRYGHNLYRHLAGVTQCFEQRLMQRMLPQGHPDLRPAWVQIIPWVGPEGARIVDLAREQGISKQAMGQLVSEIEQAGYLLRLDDRQDQRTRRIALTRAGIALVRDASAAADQVRAEFQHILGGAALKHLERQTHRLYRHYRLPTAHASRHPDVSVDAASSLPIALHSLSGRFEQHLMEAATALGHQGLRRSFAQVLLFLSDNGTRIVDMARWQGVSKQAISQIAQTIEDAGYISRRTDSSDRRSRRLVFTTQGQQLIRDCVLLMDALDAELANILGSTDFQRLDTHLAQLHEGLNLQRPSDTQNHDAALQAWLLPLQAAPETADLFLRKNGYWQLSPQALELLKACRLPDDASTEG